MGLKVPSYAVVAVPAAFQGLVFPDGALLGEGAAVPAETWVPCKAFT